MYSPQNDELDFEIGSFGSVMKKGFKKAAKGLDKVTELTITKPSMMIGKMVGGKKGEAIGKKLGGFTSMVTKLGVGAGAAGAVAPLLASPTALTAVAAGIAGKKIKDAKKKKAKRKAAAKKKPAPKKAKASAKPKTKNTCGTNAEAAKVAALLVSKLGGPLNEANKALRLAELQRQATFEHKKLMSDGEFRKKVLTGITTLAAEGNGACERTIRVLVGR